MPVLTDRQIKELVLAQNLITDFDERSLQGASYDMRLGPQYVKYGLVNTLSEAMPTLKVGPGEFVLLRTYEKLRMPQDLIGHNGIMSPWAKRGLVSLFSPQIDPGFRGFLVVPVFNAGDSEISMTLGQQIFTVEFVRTEQAASFGWSDRYGEQNQMNVPVTPSELRPKLSHIEFIRKDLDDVQGNIVRLDNALVGIGADIKGLRTELEVMHRARAWRLSKAAIIVSVTSLLLSILVAALGSGLLRATDQRGSRPPATTATAR